MTRIEVEAGIAIWRSMRHAGSGGFLHRNLTEQFAGWAMTHGHDLLNVLAAHVGLPVLELLPQNMVIPMGDVDVRGNHPAEPAP